MTALTALLVAATFLLVVATALYVSETRKIVKASERSAEAAAKTAEEMKAQTLKMKEQMEYGLRPEVTPNLSLKVLRAEGSCEEIKVTFINGGRGMALNASFGILHSQLVFKGPGPVKNIPPSSSETFSFFADLPPGDTKVDPFYEIQAAYDDTFGNRWSTLTKLIRDEGSGLLKHRETAIEKVGLES
ncbi:MAG TPA: hypothetical protein VJ565_00655 [Dehalococcoidia bacterium]|nr:hypothetical protein [Dehalococcoidia bacterium]